MRGTGLKPLTHNRSLSRRGTKQPFRLFDGWGQAELRVQVYAHRSVTVQVPYICLAQKKQALACLFFIGADEGT